LLFLEELTVCRQQPLDPDITAARSYLAGAGDPPRLPRKSVSDKFAPLAEVRAACCFMSFFRRAIPRCHMNATNAKGKA
jgi:hypothetical protein